jgi:hypothetical protein
MPWYRTKHTLPPKDTEITMFKDGVKTTKKFDLYEIFDGRGGINPDFGEWWTYNKDLPDPPEAEDKGISHLIPVAIQEHEVRPKIVKGKKAPPGPDYLGEGSLDNR